MYLIVKHPKHPQKELSFRDGPIYIGRQLGSQVFLPDKAVSRQHAVIYTTTDGKWVLEDLDSANKTFLNGKAIHKAQLHDGDLFTVSKFNIEVKLRDVSSQPAAINMDDTLLSANSEMRSIVRKVGDTNGPAFRLSPKGVKYYAEITCVLFTAQSRNELLDILLNNLKKQLFTARIWIGFKKSNGNSFDVYKGKATSGQGVQLDDLFLKGNIVTAMENKDYILFPRFNIDKKNKHKIRSAMIAPIIHSDDCLGVMYLDNSLNHEQYDIMDLNYLMLLSINLGSILDKYEHE